MKPELLTLGNSQSRVVVIDDFTGTYNQICRMAAALPPSRRNRNITPVCAG